MKLGLSVLVIMLAQGVMGATQIKVWHANWFPPQPSVTNVPPGLTNAVAIACGSGHMLALTSEGRVVGWGDNTYGQIDIPVGLSNIVAISAYSSNSLALTTSGELVSWGNECSTNPLPPFPAYLTNIIGIAGGSTSGFGLGADGSYFTWGCNPENLDERLVSPGQLPTGATNVSNVVFCAYGEYSRGILDASGTGFVRVQPGQPNVFTNVVALSVGYYHALALSADGRVTTWHQFFGSDSYLAITNAVAIASGFTVGYALLNDGNFVRWGVQVPPSTLSTVYQGSNILAIAASGHASAILIDLDPQAPPPPDFVLPPPQVGTNGITISLPTERGRVYSLERKSSFTEPWSLQQLVAGNGGIREVVVPVSGQGFFRTRRVK